jgi:AraC family transcriptional regulator of adaptative response / DNA-3-methyladenine glycosylase II
MRWNEDRLYALFLARDSSQNGKFLTGVLTTGIYCLPSCPARRPKRENVRFFRTPEEAVGIGLRPCRRCRPDSYYRGEEWHENLYEQTIARVHVNPGAFGGVPDLAAAAGLSRTALSDLFRHHAQESPAAFLRRARMERVCELLGKGIKPADASAEAGFASSSAFHSQFGARTGLTPGAYAALGNEFALRLPSAYRFREVLDFYGRDPQSVSECVSSTSLRKCVLIEGEARLIEIAFRGTSARCSVEGAPREAHRLIVRMLGLDSDADAFERQFAADSLLGHLVKKQRGLRIPLTPEPWEALAWAILGQQISLKAAVTLRRGLIESLGKTHPSGLRAHPPAEDVADLDLETLRRLKFSGSKAEYLIAAAQAVKSREVPLATMRRMSAAHASRRMRNVRGIGPWTVQYALLRGVGFADCLPAGDAGLAQGLARLLDARPSEPEIRDLMARYSPWRSVATYHVWASLKGKMNED